MAIFINVKPSVENFDTVCRYYKSNVLKTNKNVKRKASLSKYGMQKQKNAVSDIVPAVLFTGALILVSIAASLSSMENADIQEHSIEQISESDTLPVSDPPEEPITGPEQQPGCKGTIVFVIDDAGHSLPELEAFLDFPGPLTIAVLPGLPHSAEAARRIRAAEKELFLHQPMEAIGGQHPGPGAIYAGMNTEDILAILHQNISEIGPVAGMNNHQGSKITADREIMETILAFCREQEIPFLDSKTTHVSAVPAAAKNLGIAIGERNFFIDNNQDYNSMQSVINEGLEIAAARGSVIMIGHVWSLELAPLLINLYQDLIDQGYVFAAASDLINNPAAKVH